jgi:hypothetical protein
MSWGKFSWDVRKRVERKEVEVKTVVFVNELWEWYLNFIWIDLSYMIKKKDKMFC